MWVRRGFFWRQLSWYGCNGITQGGESHGDLKDVSKVLTFSLKCGHSWGRPGPPWWTGTKATRLGCVAFGLEPQALFPCWGTPYQRKRDTVAFRAQQMLWVNPGDVLCKTGLYWKAKKNDFGFWDLVSWWTLLGKVSVKNIHKI